MGSKPEVGESFELEHRPKRHHSPAPSLDDLDSPSFSDYGEDEEREEVGRFLPYTAEEERAVVKKLDRRLVLFVALLYMLSFLDRSSTIMTIDHVLE